MLLVSVAWTSGFGCSDDSPLLVLGTSSLLAFVTSSSPPEICCLVDDVAPESMDESATAASADTATAGTATENVFRLSVPSSDGSSRRCELGDASLAAIVLPPSNSDAVQGCRQLVWRKSGQYASEIENYIFSSLIMYFFLCRVFYKLWQR